MRAIFVACLLATLALAGCVSPATGLSHQATAEKEATSLHEDAVLVGIMGAEWANESLADDVTKESPEAQALVKQGTDPNPGDGLANAWAYFFRSEASDIVVVVGADGSVLDSQTLNPGGAGSQSFQFNAPIGEVSIDSDEAAAIVNENHERFPDLITSEDVVVMMFLIADEEYLDGLFWAFMAFTPGGEDLAFALVNAEDGSYQDFSDFFGG